MKKKFFAAAVAFVATMSLATSAFAAAPGRSDGGSTNTTPGGSDTKAPSAVGSLGGSTGTGTSTPSGDGDKVTTDDGVSVEGDLPAGATLETKVQPVESAAVTQPKLEQAIAKIANVSGSEAAVTVNTKLEISLTSGGVAVQPNGKVKVTVAWDGKSNIVAYVDGDKIEFFALTVSGNVCSFETTHFSDYFMATVDSAVVNKLVGQSVDLGTGGSTTNPETGVALAVAPAALAVAFVGVTAIISKKKRG